MTRPGKSDRERDYEKLIELAEKYLNVQAKTTEAKKAQREELKKQISLLDISFSKLDDALKNEETIKDNLTIYRTQLKILREIREEKEKEYRIEEEKQKLLEKERNSYKKFESDYSNFYNKYLNNERRNFTDTLKNLGNLRQGNNLNKVNELKSEISENVVKQYARLGKTDPKYYRRND